MKTLVLTAHPDLSSSTANRKWFEALSGVEGVITRDLTSIAGAEMRFNPSIEQALLEQADRIVMQFPFYWYSSPPVLKAWIDQVLLFGFSYGQGGDKLQGKDLILAITTGGPAESFQEGSLNSFSMNEFLTPFEQTANMVGMNYLPPFVLHSAMSRDKTKLDTSTAELISYVTKPRVKTHRKQAHENALTQ